MSNFFWVFVGLGAALLVGLAVALWRAPQAELVTHIEIHAPPDQVWALLGNPASYAQWNPFIVSMQGQLKPGTRLLNKLQSSSGQTMQFRPTLLKVQQARELRWLGRLGLPRIFDGEHYFELTEQAGPGSLGGQPVTVLRHGERFRGLALWWINVEQFRVDFERMNWALKRAVEQAVHS